MLKKLWENYSYAIILVVLSLLSMLLLKINFSFTPDNYMKITVKQGESLWKIAERYENEHGLSERAFVKWVEQYNGISGDHINVGEELVIPIEAESIEVKEYNNLASK